MGRRVVIGVVGLVVVLGWWTLIGRGGKSDTTVARIPDRIWEGGGGKTTVDVEFSHPGEVTLDFYCWDESGKSPHAAQSFIAKQDVPAGKHHFVVEVTPKTNVCGYFRIPGSKKGARIAYTLVCGAKKIGSDEGTAEEDAQPGNDFELRTPIVPEAGTGEGW